MKLTPNVLVSKNPGTPIAELVSANCSNMEIAHIEDLSVAVNLHKLDLSKNSIKKADALSGLKHNKELTLLNLNGNSLESLEGVEYLEKLLVLNLSHNQVNRISHHVASCQALKALILNHNKIARIENLTKLTQLNTIVLSHNSLTSLEGLGSLINLTKLSAAHNQIRVFPDLRLLPALKELRLNDNKIMSISDNVRFLPALEILDMGNNVMRSIADVASLASLNGLINLNLKGNPLVEKEKGGADTKEGTIDKYRQTVLTLCPTLRVLDNDRFDQKFLERKSKRQELIKKRTWRENVEKAQAYAANPPPPHEKGSFKKRKLDGGSGDEGPEERKSDRKPSVPTTGKPDDGSYKRKRESGPKSHNTNSPKKAEKAGIASKRVKDEGPATSAKKQMITKERDGKKDEERPAKVAASVRREWPQKLKRRDTKAAPPAADEGDSFFLADKPKAQAPGKKSGAGSKGSSAAEPKSTKTGTNPAQAVHSKGKDNGAVTSVPAVIASTQSRGDSQPVASTTSAPVAPVNPARSGVLGVVEVKPKIKKAVTAFDPEVAKTTAPNSEGTGLLVGGWD
ncbi:hypothetical protein PhCBS80983_g02667 [Powellomyces hirtus]|uniref:U2A'/phosphoprotein 32 family A C-terminal domain-containing protein n=1 Tax=Powellomyces hirtus TaxID=109895 RepID=A0A507E761_9FUNG|nr:hypothetical protein PhCBS80983_g02667 [Powellomyces hirtus]